MVARLLLSIAVAALLAAASDAAGPRAAAGAGVVVSQAPPVPVLSRSAVLEERRGEVRVRVPGTRRFVPLEEATEVPTGTEIDAREGRVRLTAARDASGRTMSAVFYAGRFVFTQGEGRRPYVTLSLSGGRFRGCGPRHPDLKVDIAARRKGKRREIRRLWGDGEGRFRTKGRYASATIRGTKWLTIDRCDGVAVRVRRGEVAFRDLLRGRRAERIRAGRRGFVPSRQAEP